MRLMAIDYGEKRVGIASTDETGGFALPRVVWPNDRNLIDNILKLKGEEGIEKIIIGESRNLDGSANLIQKAIESLKNELEKHNVEVIYHPEIFTTLEARQIQGQTEMTDASAAAIILKSYLDSR
ncbi:MAG: Holliday junction resolvase RuvX [bacterium]|nr:Holliday junction resolvase RuvX [bacterium]